MDGNRLDFSVGRFRTTASRKRWYGTQTSSRYIEKLSDGETKEFVISWFPAVLESDFDKVKGYQVEKLEYDDGKK